MRKVFGKGFGFGAATSGDNESSTSQVYFTYPYDEIRVYETEELGMSLYANFFANSDIVPAAYYYSGTHQRIYFRFFEGLKDAAGQDRTGFYSRNWISFYDVKKKTFGSKYVMPCDYPSSTDYHNQGAIIVADDGHIIYIQEKLNTPGGHNSPLEIYRSNYTEDISSMSLINTITGEFTYPMIRKMSDGTLFIMARERISGEERYLKILKSIDNGLTWAGLTGTANVPTTVIDLGLSGWFLYKYNVYSNESESINIAVVAHQGTDSYGRRLYFLHSEDGRNWVNAREYITEGAGYNRDIITDGILTDTLLQTNYMVDSIAEGSSTEGLGSRFGGLNSLDKVPILTYWIYNPSIACADNITSFYISVYNNEIDEWVKKDILSILSSGRNFSAEYLVNYYNHIYSYGNGVIDLVIPNIIKDNNIINSNLVINSGTLKGGVYYRIITTETNHFGTNVVAGNVKRSNGTETCDSNNTVMPIKLGVSVFRSADYGQSWNLLLETDKYISESAQGNVGILDNIYDNPDYGCFFFSIMRSKAASVIEYCDLGMLFTKKISPDVLHSQSIIPGTPVTPSLTTADLSEVRAYTADAGGNVTDDGGASVTAKGVCWSTSQMPTISDNLTNDGTGEGSYTSILTGLNPETTYYIRAYATNSKGTSYGVQKSITTLAALAPTVTTASITGISDKFASGGGNVTDDGNVDVTEKGICWSTSQNPTTSDNHTSDGTGEGAFVSTIPSLTPETTYYVRAYAINSIGTSYGAQESFVTLVESTGSVYGYIAGGKTEATYEASAEKITFSTGIYAANTVSNLSVARGFISALSDKNSYGYFCGGHTGGHTNYTDRLTFSTGGNSANTSSNLSAPRSYTQAISDTGTYGYICGGYSGNNTAVTDRITFSTSITAANTVSDLSLARRNGAEISDNNAYGYVLGGYASSAVTTADRLTFSNGITVANTSSNLSSARHALCGISDQSTYGYAIGGASDGSGTEVTTADRINFSTGSTAANTVSNLSSVRAYLVGLSEGETFGYISGGVAGTTPTNTKITDRLTFSTGVTAANTVSNLTEVRQGHGGMGDKSV